MSFGFKAIPESKSLRFGEHQFIHLQSGHNENHDRDTGNDTFSN